jgi:hypothetical protein
MTEVEDMGLFTPKWKTNDRSKQIKAVEAVRKVTNEKELRRIALEAPLPDVRMIAVYQMKNLAQLREMALSGDKFRLCPVCMKPNSIDVRIMPLSRCNMLDGEKDFQHANKWKTEYYRLGFYIPWHRAKW